MKSYTDLEQSKKLAEILPVEGADMFIADVFLKEEQTHSYNFHFLTTWGHKNFDELKERENKFVQFIPCWSLAALLNVLPSSTLDSSDNHRYRFRCMERYTEWYDNAIDACVAMIERLHELKML